jgi:hypothetical protein
MKQGLENVRASNRSLLNTRDQILTKKKRFDQEKTIKKRQKFILDPTH